MSIPKPIFLQNQIRIHPLTTTKYASKMLCTEHLLNKSSGIVCERGVVIQTTHAGARMQTARHPCSLDYNFARAPNSVFGRNYRTQQIAKPKTLTKKFSCCLLATFAFKRFRKAQVCFCTEPNSWKSSWFKSQANILGPLAKTSHRVAHETPIPSGVAATLCSASARECPERNHKS